MTITVKSNVYEEIFDNEAGITLPVLCPNSKPKVNNINLSGIKNILNETNNLWSEESKTDLADLLVNEPANKEFVGLGEIILSPSINPEHYYHIQQREGKEGKVYITITRCEKHNKYERKTKKRNTIKITNEIKPKKTTTVKITKEIPSKQETSTEEKKQPTKPRTKKPRKTEELNLNDFFTDNRELKQKMSSSNSNKELNLEFFLCLKMRDALDEYIKLKFPEQKRILNKLSKK